MVREEAIIEMQLLKESYCNTHTEAQLKKNRKTIDAYDMAIKALEQESKADVLDKIKTEIESKMETIIGRYDSTIPMYDMASYKVERNKVREECIEIIDKYRQEG